MMEMTKWERLYAAVKGQPTDRVGVALWRHFPGDDMTPEGLAHRTLEFQKKYDWDLIKFTPTGTYGVMDWGVETTWKPNPQGVRTVLKYAIHSIDEWQTLPLPDTRHGFYGQQNQALSLLAREINGETPILQTIFSPLTTAWKLAGDRLFSDMRTRPDFLQEGLEVITRVTLQFSLEAIQSGADGFFFATQTATNRLLNPSEHQEFGEVFDRRILDVLKDKVDFLMLHVHGLEPMFNRLIQYPVNMISWHDRLTAPSLQDARQQFSGLLAGGVDEKNTLHSGPVSRIQAQVQDAIQQVKGRGLLIAPGCVVPLNAPEAHLMVVRKAVEHTD